MENFINSEVEFINFYLNRISESFNKTKAYFSTKYDVKDNFKLDDKVFRNKCQRLDKKLFGIKESDFQSIFLVPKNVTRKDLSIFLISS